MSANRARSRAYALFSHLLLDPIDSATASQLAEVSFLAEALRSTPSLDELAAEHHALFSFEVAPHQGAFLDTEGLVGGTHAQELHELYVACGFMAKRRDTSADHLGVMLGALAFLTGAASDAREDGQEGRASAIDEHVRTLLDRHLLRWFPSFATAALRNSQGFWQVVVELLVELISDHRASLGKPATDAASLPEPPALLEDERTSIRNIARFLTTPCSAGTCITRTDIAGMGRALDIPRGFGSRTNMLENLLRGAAEYDNFAAALAAVTSVIDTHADQLAASASANPSFAPSAAQWLERIEQTRSLLEHMRSDAISVQTDPPAMP